MISWSCFIFFRTVSFIYFKQTDTIQVKEKPMSKIIKNVFIVFILFSIFACNNNNTNHEEGTLMDSCYGHSNFVVVNGVCIVTNETLEDSIQITDEEKDTIYSGSIELMEDYVADLSDSVGLAVIPRSTYEESTTHLLRYTPNDLDELLSVTMTEDTENIIVKLTEEGYFEEVDFTDEAGENIDITANPLALQIYGDYTLIIFEVISEDNEEEETAFSLKVNHSLNSGGVYLIHNASGKMFATREVHYKENVYTETVSSTRTINLSVTLNEPVYEKKSIIRVDEFGIPVKDAYGNVIYDEVLVQILDDDGNPLIFTEGPIQTEIKSLPKVEYYQVVVYDEETQQQLTTIVSRNVLDTNGNLIYENQEVAVLDNNGNPVYKNEFEVSLEIKEFTNITHTIYEATITKNPLSQLADNLVSNIMTDYNHWNYNSLQEYVISGWGFAIAEGDLYFIKRVETGTISQSYIVHMYFDEETNEIVLEDYLNLTLAGFVNSIIALDPNTGTVFSLDQYQTRNVKVYSPDFGMKTIANSEKFRIVIFPDGHLFFYTGITEYSQAYGYSTLILYSIDSSGNLISNYLELGMYEERCVNDTLTDAVSSSTILDEYGNAYYSGSAHGINLLLHYKDLLIDKATFQLTSISEFDSSRPACASDSCGYQVTYIILDSEDEVLGIVDAIMTVSLGEAAPAYEYVYRVGDSGVTLSYTGNNATYDNYSFLVNLRIADDSQVGYTNLGPFEIIFNNGSPLFDMITIESGSIPYSFEDSIRCKSSAGCIINTYNLIVLDELGNEYDLPSINTGYLPVLFHIGDPLPLGEFTATFTLKDPIYQTTYASISNLFGELIMINDNTFYVLDSYSNWSTYSIIIQRNEENGTYKAFSTNLNFAGEFIVSGNSIIVINDDRDAIYRYTLNPIKSTDGFFYFDMVNLAESLQINAIDKLIVDYDGSIYFVGVNAFVQSITGTISAEGIVTIDTEYIEHEIIRVAPIN